jgi:hypothetical protein
MVNKYNKDIKKKQKNLGYFIMMISVSHFFHKGIA